LLPNLISVKTTEELTMKSHQVCLTLSLLLGVFSLNLIVNQPVFSQESETEPTQPRKRLRATFFEEERRLKFGDGLFLQSALDGAQNAFPDPAKIGNFNSDLIRNGRPIDGTVVIQSRDSDDSNYLWTDFNPSDPSRYSSFQFRDVVPNSSNETIGRVTVIGDPSFTGRYNAGYSSEGDKFGATILVTDPNNPNQSILIEVRPVSLENFSDLDDSQPTPPARATLTTGLPTDR
jgi:hypothetical protein